MDERDAAKSESAAAGGARPRVAAETLGQLGAQVAHDFNNVLAVALTSVEMAMRVGDVAKANTFLANAIKTIHRGRELTDRLASASRACAKLDAVDAHALLSKIRAELEAENPAVQSVVRAEAVRSSVLADAVFLERALRHLAANAIDAMPNGGTLTFTTRNAPGSELRADASRDYLLVAVADTGEGMADDVRLRAFELFFSTREGSDRGIGLAQTRDAVRRVGGFASIESEEGRGSTVTIAIPLDVPAGA